MNLKYSPYYLGDQKPIPWNIPQSWAVSATQKRIVLEWGRGTGKSTVLAWFMMKMAVEMPRGHFTIFGETYSNILTTTLPGTIEGLEMLGWKMNVHFFVGRRAPAKWKWKEPYQPPLDDYHYTIHTYTGACFSLVSLDMKSGGKGRNRDASIGDQVELCNYERYIDNVHNTIRGTRNAFKNCSMYKSQVFALNVPMTNVGNWVIKLEEEAKLNPSEICYLRADSFFNKLVLGEQYFIDAKRLLTTSLYNADILNIRPGKIEGGFYPTFNENKHCRDMFNNSFLINLDYDFTKAKNAKCLGDGDLQANLPIDIACDYNAAICTIVANQDYGNESRWLSAMYIKAPFLIDSLINKFCDYYENHREKTVNYYYDHTAVGTDAGRSKTYEQMVTETFIKRGWRVNKKYMGKAPTHRSRYVFWGISFQETDRRLPKHRFNTTNCKYLIISVNKAGVRQGRNGEEKDKRPETASNAIDEETTHFSDAMDTLGYFKYSHRTKESKGHFIAQ